MQELIDKLMAEGLTEKQALKAVEIVKNFAKSKFPLFAGAIEKVFDKYAPKDLSDQDRLAYVIQLIGPLKVLAEGPLEIQNDNPK